MEGDGANGRFQFLGQLAPGDASTVLAFQKGLGGFRRLVVLKLLGPDDLRDHSAHQQFIADLRSAASFSHPYVADVHELDVEEGQLFVSTEWVAGASLRELVEASRAVSQVLPLGFVLRAVRDAAHALHYAHTFADAFGRPRPLLHRAFTDARLIVTFEGVSKVIGFGLPRPPLRWGSLFTAPEALRGEELDGRSDLFSLGAVLHAALTGMKHKYAAVLARAPSRTEFPPPSECHPEATPELDAVLLRALYPTRDSRYASALEFARELERIAGALLFLPDQSAALVQRYFHGRREQLKSLVSAEELKPATPAMPLASHLREVPTVIAPSAGALGEGRDEMHTRMLPVVGPPREAASARLPAADPEARAAPLFDEVAADELLDDLSARRDDEHTQQLAPQSLAGSGSASRGRFAPVLDDLPSTGPLPALRPEALRRPSRSDLDEVQSPPSRWFLKLVIALVMLAGVAAVGAWVLVPRWSRQQVARGKALLFGRPVPAEPAVSAPPIAPRPVEAADAGAALAEEAALDAGALEATALPLDAGTTVDAEAGEEQAAPKKKSVKKKRRYRR